MTADEKLQYTGTVADDGKITLPGRVKSDLARLFSGREIVVTFERKRSRRSKNQNAYYWAVVVQMICEAMNQNEDNVLPQEVHEFLKHRFLKIQKIDHDTGEVLYEFSRSTTGLKTFEFSLYLDQCIQFGAQFLNITIPPPHVQSDEYQFPEYQRKKEDRAEYLERVADYLSEITHRWQLEKYFQQVPEWKKDDDVRGLFNQRYNELR